MGSVDRDFMGSLMSGMGTALALGLLPFLAIYLGNLYGLSVSGGFASTKIGTAALMIVFFPFLMWLNLPCIPVGILMAILLGRFWLRPAERLGIWFLLCGTGALYGFLISEASFLWIVVFWVVLAFLWAGIRLYVWRNYLALERMNAEDMYTEEERSRPPSSQGICQKCDRYSPRIYYLPDGTRVCEECYKPSAEPVEPSNKGREHE